MNDKGLWASKRQSLPCWQHYSSALPVFPAQNERPAKNWRTPAAARLPAPRRLRRLSARSNIEPHEGSRESSPCPLPSLSALCASDPSCDTPSKTHTESASGFRKEPSKGTQSIPRMSLNHPEVCTARREHAPSPGAQRPQSSQGNADRGVWPSRKIRASGRQEAEQQTVKALGVLCCAFCYIALCALMLAAARRKLSQARELVKAKCLKSVGLKAGARFYRGKKTRGRQAVILRQGMAAGERTRGSKPALAKQRGSARRGGFPHCQKGRAASATAARAESKAFPRVGVNKGEKG